MTIKDYDTHTTIKVSASKYNQIFFRWYLAPGNHDAIHVTEVLRDSWCDRQHQEVQGKADRYYYCSYGGTPRSTRQHEVMD